MIQQFFQALQNSLPEDIKPLVQLPNIQNTNTVDQITAQNIQAGKDNINAISSTRTQDRLRKISLVVPSIYDAAQKANIGNSLLMKYQ